MLLVSGSHVLCDQMDLSILSAQVSTETQQVAYWPTEHKQLLQAFGHIGRAIRSPTVSLTD